MTVKTLSLLPTVPVRAKGIRTAVPAALTFAALLFASVSVSSAALTEDVDETLMEDIHGLVMNTWDTKMARQYQMGVEMPASEVEARLEIAGRWAKAIEDGDFGANHKLPEGFADQYKAMVKMVKEAKGKDDVDLDPALMFLETSVPALQKASGLNIAPPM